MSDTFSCKYTDADRQEVTEDYMIHYWPIMDWIKEVYSDERLFQKISLYPVKKYLATAHEDIEFFDDPVCGSDLWDIQVCEALLLWNVF